MKTISVYSQKDLDEIERGFDGRINIYGGNWCSPIKDDAILVLEDIRGDNNG